MTATDRPLISLGDVSARIGKKELVSNINWDLSENRSWAVIGPNGSGKTSLIRIITGDLSHCSGDVDFHQGFTRGTVSAVTHEQHLALIRAEAKKNIFEFHGEYSDKFITARKLITGGREELKLDAKLEKTAGELRITHLLDRGVKYLSTGEIRKVLIAGALAASPRVLILDEPFEGLDTEAAQSLSAIIRGLIEKKIVVILVTHRRDLIPEAISHVLCLKEGRLLASGTREEILVPDVMDKLYDNRPAAFPHMPELEKSTGNSFFRESDTLIAMENVSVSYNSVPTLTRINWEMKKGENWTVTGPNGAGKSTLLSLISGDNPKAYGHEIHLFGQKRGTGETVWDIKERVGFISSEFQVGYVDDITAFQVVLSGFFDSVGLYDRASAVQKETAAAWIRSLSLEENSHRNFGELSFGEQRCFLLCRAMVKMPLLLILDEPCQGLDPSGRRLFLSLLDHIGETTPTHILYVTHHEEENLSCIHRKLRLEPFEGGGYTARAVDVKMDSRE